MDSADSSKELLSKTAQAAYSEPSVLHVLNKQLGMMDE
jgi:hypothetical protein